MQYVISSSLDCTLRVWELSTGACVRIVKVPSPINTFVLSLSGDLLIAGTESGCLYFIDIRKTSNQHFYRASMVLEEEKNSASKRVRSISFSTDESSYVVTRKHQIAICSTSQIFQIKQEVEAIEQLKEKGKISHEEVLKQIGGLWKREFKSLCSNFYENKKMDQVAAHYLASNQIVCFSRNQAA